MEQEHDHGTDKVDLVRGEVYELKLMPAKEPVKEGRAHFISSDGKGRIVFFDTDFTTWFTENSAQQNHVISAKITRMTEKFYIAQPIEILNR